MSLFDFLKKGPTKSGIEGQVRKAKERYAQPDYRRMAMDKLLKWHTKESLAGLLERFCVVVQSPHWDEEEKVWLRDQFIEMGEEAEPILRDFILQKEDINYALEAYQAIAGQDKYKQLLIECLKSRPPSDHRSVRGKVEIIAALDSLSHEDLDDVFLPYLRDHSDDVQSATIAILANSKNQHVQQALVDLLRSEEHSPRVLRDVAGVVAKYKLPVGDGFVLNDVVSEDYKIEKGTLVARA